MIKYLRMHGRMLNLTMLNVYTIAHIGTLFNLDWRDHAKLKLQCDIIVGSDLVYNGAPLEELY